MKETILFIHGMFQNEKSWMGWIHFFERLGYQCLAPSWPFHEGEPAQLRRQVPEGLGDLRLQTVIDMYSDNIRKMDTTPVLIGHSVGGLIVQALVNKGLAKAGVCISSVAPNRMLAFDWGLFKNSVSISNPFKGDEPFFMTPEGFHENFANAMSRKDSDAAYERTATHDSRNMLRDCLMEAGTLNFDLPHVPLLFVAGEIDEIIPPELNEKNSKAYSDEGSIVGYMEFPRRGHFICGQPGWEEIATYVAQWLVTSAGIRTMAQAHPIEIY